MTFDQVLYVGIGIVLLIVTLLFYKFAAEGKAKVVKKGEVGFKSKSFHVYFEIETKPWFRKVKKRTFVHKVSRETFYKLKIGDKRNFSYRINYIFGTIKPIGFV